MCPLPPPLCFAMQNIGEVSVGRRGWKIPTGRGGKEIPAEETETDTNLWGPRKKYKERVQSIAIPRKNALCRVGWKLFELLFLLSLYLCYLCSRKLLGSVRAQYVKHERFFFHTPAICAPL